MEEKIGYHEKSSKGETSEVNNEGKEHNAKRVYLAGPDVFFPNAIEIGNAKKRICAQYGFEG
ncbi:MAG: hypothetical protein RI591_06525, partial [Dehalococcoidia bacterium]|nr:hypothetical protein [Dehalococcoidia bacterium]